MSLAPGVRFGAYEVLALLGAGGMGEVYSARDPRLGRDVALKVLPSVFAHDPERLARFKREAQVLASLNHPNIAAIYGLEEADGIRALVLELVEGPTLAELIAQPAGSKGPGLRIEEALPIARQITDALEAAHEKGVVHRDLKPANIKITPEGIVKVLDFGLAKALDPVAPGFGPATGDLTNSPTMSAAATRAGTILGTAAYMSPEQARGQAVDKRADIWAFGCVLYEMLTGKRAFEGDEVSDTLAAILRAEPDWTALPPSTPATIRRLLRRCLDKNPRERLHDISDARFELKEAIAASTEVASAQAIPTAAARPLPISHGRAAAMLALGLVAGGTLAAATVWFALRPTAPRVTRLTVTPSGPAALVMGGITRDLAISPDGTRLVYIGGNGSQLFVRALDQLEATPLSGVGAPRGPFFSPDGQWIGYFDGLTGLKKVSISGGPPVTLCRVSGGPPRGATWGPDNTIIFATNDASSGLLRVSAAGGEPTVLTTPNRAQGERGHFWPEFIPGSQAVLFTIVPNGAIENTQVAVLDLKTGKQKILVRGGSDAHYVPSGHLVYAAAGTLRAVAFDLDRLEPVGNPVPVVPQVVTTQDGGADVDVAHDGTFVYVTGGGQVNARTLAWVDRQGREEPLNAPTRAYTYPRLSPDGQRLALDVRDQESDIWIWDFSRETLTRFTFDPGQDLNPTWTPDGRRLIFASGRAGVNNLFWQASDGTGTVERLSESPNLQNPNAISPDGTRLVFRADAPKTGQDLMVLTLDKDHRAQPLVQTAFNELNGQISPDGRWLAYQSDESGQNEIFVRPFPNVGGGLRQISTGGGSQPLWARNGQELFYLAPTGTLMSVRIEHGSTFAVAAPTKLFEGRGRYYLGGGVNQGRTYDVSLDGQRFLMIKTSGGTDGTAAPASITVVLNWFEELKRLAPAKR